MVLLESPQTLSAATLTAAWATTWPDTSGPTAIHRDSDDTGTVLFDLGGMTGAVAMMPVPVPAGELEGAAMASWLWPNATQDVTHVGAHVIAWIAGPGQLIDAYGHLTRLVCAIAKATDAAGVYWGSAGHVIRADIFDGLAHAEEDLPVMLWINFGVSVDHGVSSLFTMGLRAFDVMEIEISSSTRQPGDLREFAMHIASWLIRDRPSLEDGHTVGRSADERVRVRHAPSMLARTDTVYRLEGF
jgi:Domain of unknown function (DUF4261)